MFRPLPALAMILTAFASPALAHSGHGGTSGLLSGLAHPVFGLDHLAAMLAVGLWAGFEMPTRPWVGPVAFLSAMAAGAGLSWAGIMLPMIETMITMSVMIFGILIIAAFNGQRRGVTRASVVAIAVFALAHGHAHATEASGDALPYLAGFLIATAALHLAGLALARAIAAGTAALALQRATGGVITALGLWILAA